ncbi:hypothetical protein GCM10011332_07640 [Terasakiella brassicae]|uniref:ATP-binding protein n=1 Tax=Terasakiella brassicae TaxID=1634917 RepID=A0A917FA15_9PROT|nr:ATP-binding protein [Terasakiella brassicae]GGF56639.1 hypothetical protein GCM10011332_07640 [Terasakiella brassicae]
MSDQLPVDFGMERKFVFNALTSDISTTDSLLDLIDNSIDAARRDIVDKKKAMVNGLPETYEGYEIKLSLDDDKIIIEDNCRGMETNLLEGTAFRLGARHNQNFSIGIYGVGLIRAFWKLGNEGTLITDNGEEAFSLHFNKSDLEENETTLFADRTISSGKRSNKFIIDRLTLDAAYDLEDKEWYNKLIDRIRRVYGLCIRKGLKIQVGKYVIPEFGPQIREDVKELKGGTQFRTSNGVDVNVQIGAHEKYIFKGEEGWSQRANSDVIPECGWYVVCNDRIVLTADRTVKVGWTSTWHSEYNGILGWVFFTSDDADLLPWDSKKTDISLEKVSQREAAKALKALSDTYRSTNRNFKYGQPASSPTRPGPKGGKGGKNGPTSAPIKIPPKPTATATKPTTSSQDHNENWDTLLPAMNVLLNDKKLSALIHEAQNIQIKHPYACLMLYRTVFERAVTVRIRQEGYYGAVKKMVIDEQEKQGRTFSEAAKKNFKPTLANLLDWMTANEEIIFYEDHLRDCKRGLGNFKSHLKHMNGVVHEGDLTDSGKVKTVRTDTYNLLSFLIETLILRQS